MLRDPERRILLAKLLKIPPALLGLDWRTVFYTDNTGQHTIPSTQADESWLEDSFFHYEDSLAMTWNLSYSGQFVQVVDRFERRLKKLDTLVRQISGPEKEAWLGLLCQYYQAGVQTPQHCGSGEPAKALALQRCQTALQIASEIDDKELLAAGSFRLADIYESFGDYQQAQEKIQIAVQYAEQGCSATRGNIYLRAAVLGARFAGNDTTQLSSVHDWQDKALDIMARGDPEPERGSIRLNQAAIHHERAKTLLRIYQMDTQEKSLLYDAHNEMQIAWRKLTPDLAGWKMYFFASEARLYLAQNDLERSADLALEALQAARDSRSNRGERQVRELFLELRRCDTVNPHVCRLGVELGIF